MCFRLTHSSEGDKLNSDKYLPAWWNGRHQGLKIPCSLAAYPFESGRRHHRYVWKLSELRVLKASFLPSQRNRLPESGSQFRNRSDNYFTLYRAFRNVPILTICPAFNKSAITRSTVVALMSGSRCRISDLETGTKLFSRTFSTC